LTAYCTLSELQDTLRIGDAEDSEALMTAINAASARIDALCGRTFDRQPSPTERTFEVFEPGFVFIDDVSTLEGLTINDADYAERFTPDPLNALVLGEPVTALRAAPGAVRIGDLLRVSARWGWPDVPVAIRQATIILAGRYFKRGDSLLGVAGFSDLGAVMVRNVDPDVEQLVARYRRGDTGFGIA
jgi:hypothetical protein